MIIVTSERIKGSNRKDQEGEAKEMILRWRTRRRTKRSTEGKREERRSSHVSFVLPSQTWLSRLIDTIRTSERTNGLLLRSPSYPMRLWHQLSHSSTSQADTTHAVDTSNAFCKLFVVITWLSTPMFCLISHFPRCSYFL